MMRKEGKPTIVEALDRNNNVIKIKNLKSEERVSKKVELSD